MSLEKSCNIYFFFLVSFWEMPTQQHLTHCNTGAMYFVLLNEKGQTVCLKQFVIWLHRHHIAWNFKEAYESIRMCGCFFNGFCNIGHFLSFRKHITELTRLAMAHNRFFLAGLLVLCSKYVFTHRCNGGLTQESKTTNILFAWWKLNWQRCCCIIWTAKKVWWCYLCFFLFL